MNSAKVVADVAGRLIVISAEVGTSVVAGDELALLESMKMEIPVVAPTSGVVVTILVQPEDMVEQGQTLFVIERKTN